MEFRHILMVLPLLLIQIALAIVAILDLTKKGQTTYLNKKIWIIIVLFVSMFGPVAYFMLEGKNEDESS